MVGTKPDGDVCNWMVLLGAQKTPTLTGRVVGRDTQSTGPGPHYACPFVSSAKGMLGKQPLTQASGLLFVHKHDSLHVRKASVAPVPPHPSKRTRFIF